MILGFTEKLREWLRQHPSVRDALVWAVPAIALGAVLRAVLLSYLPYAYWGSDSNSYFGFAERLLTEGKISLYDKRRFTYPLAMLPIAILPGATLHWVAWLQHAFGLLTLVPLAYCVRKTFTFWRWWIVPVTVLYAGLPIILWYEHEMLAEALFFAALIWTMAGWQAWALVENPLLRAQRWWVFFAPFAVLVLTKPAGRFLWPGILLAMLLALGWRWVHRREAISLAAAAVLTLLIGQGTQGSWLLYTSAFPLTQLDSPPHTGLKGEIRDLVEEARQGLERREITEDRAWKRFLKSPELQDARPLWRDLASDDEHKAGIYRDLALEGIRTEPGLFLLIAMQKILLSANPDDFKAERFDQGYTVEKFEHLYERYRSQSPWRLRNLFGLPADAALPDYAEVQRWIAPPGRDTQEGWVRGYAEKFEDVILLVNEPGKEGTAQRLERFGATPLGWWTLVAATLSATPWFFRRLGVWTIIAVGYLVGVFLVGGANPRFFGAVWSVIVLLLPVPLDFAFRLLQVRQHDTP